MVLADIGAELRERLARVEETVAGACARRGRSVEAVKLVAASKTVAAETIRAAAAAGLRRFGENRVQERAAKRDALADLQVEWRLIGPLQSNKAARAVELFDAVDSVASLELARRLDRLAAERGRRLPILLEINLAGEPQKAGLTPAAAEEATGAIAALPALYCRGVMAVPPASGDPEASRPWFARLAELGERLRQRLGRDVSDWELSMGMSHDYAIAVEEGASMIRLGTAIFGARPAAH